MFLCISLSTGAVHLPRRGSHNQNNTTWPAKANQIDAKKMHVSAASLASDSSVRKATPSDNSERTARSGAVVETIFCQDHGVRSVEATAYFWCRTPHADKLRSTDTHRVGWCLRDLLKVEFFIVDLHFDQVFFVPLWVAGIV